MERVHNDDVEKHAGGPKEATLVDSSSQRDNSDSEHKTSPPTTKLQHLLSKLKVETRGVERIPDEERTDTSYLNIGSMVILLRKPARCRGACLFSHFLTSV